MLGQILLARGLICPADLQAALEWQQNLAGEWPVRRLGSLLIKAGVLTGSQVADALATQHGQQAASCLPRHLDPALRGVFPLRTLIRLQAVPVQLYGGTLVVAMVDPHHQDRVEELRAATDFQIKCVQAPQLQVYRLLRTLAEDPRPSGQGGTPTGPLPSLRWTMEQPVLGAGALQQAQKRPARRTVPRLQLGVWLVALAVALVALASIGLGLRMQDRALGRDTVSSLVS